MQGWSRVSTASARCGRLLRVAEPGSAGSWKGSVPGNHKCVWNYLNCWIVNTGGNKPSCKVQAESSFPAFILSHSEGLTFSSFEVFFFSSSYTYVQIKTSFEDWKSLVFSSAKIVNGVQSN